MPNYETMQVFARKLSQLLEERGIPQYVLAQELNVSNSTVCAWCSGSKMPRMNRVEQMVQFFHVPLKELLVQETPRDDVLDQVDIAFYGDFKTLTEDDRQIVRDMVALMRKRRQG